MRAVTSKSPRLFSLARIPPLRNPAHALFRAGGPDEENAGGGPAASCLPVPALGERLHGGLAGWLVAVGGCAVFVVAVGEGPDPRELCVSGQHNPTHDALLANDVVDLTGTCRSALEEEVGHGDDMMRPLRSGAKANAAGSALRPPLPSLNSGPCPRRVRVPCLPASSRRACPRRPPTARRRVWLHEIKHDGFRVIARKDGARVRLYSRPGNDLTRQFPLIAEALARLRSRSCIIDGEAVACDENRHRRVRALLRNLGSTDSAAFAFDLMELGGDDLRREPLEVRKATLACLLAGAARYPSSMSVSYIPVTPSSAIPARWGSRAS